MKNSSDPIENRPRVLLAGSPVPQPTAPPRAPSPFRIQNFSFYVTEYDIVFTTKRYKSKYSA